MTHWLLTLGAAISTVVFPAVAAADSGRPFKTASVPDPVLAQVSGMASPYLFITRNNLVTLSDAQSIIDFRSTGSLAGIQMEVWWSTTGSELITTAVRNQF